MDNLAESSLGDYCPQAQVLILRGGTILVRDGECTPLYYHLRGCARCEMKQYSLRRVQ